MQYKDLVTNFVRSWNFTRSETLAILNSLSDSELSFKPEGEKWQPLFWEFGCIGRTQMVYTEAVISGEMDFSLFSSPSLPDKSEFKDKPSLLAFLKESDRKWIEVIRSKREEEEYKIAWPGFNQPLITHITSLISHERLHHGQFISYFTMAGFTLPKSFKENWAL